MAKRKNNGMMTISEYERLTGRKYEPVETMTIDEYKVLYKMILKMSHDTENFGLFEMIIERDIEKAKYIQAIMDVLNNAPRGKAEHILDYKKVDYDYFEILEASYGD